MDGTQHLTFSLAVHLILIVVFGTEVCCPLLRDAANIAKSLESRLNSHNGSAQIVWGNQHFARLAIAIATPCGIHHHLMECAVCGLHITSHSENNSSSHSNPQLQLHHLPQQEFPDNQDTLGAH